MLLWLPSAAVKSKRSWELYEDEDGLWLLFFIETITSSIIHNFPYAFVRMIQIDVVSECRHLSI
jgi:hypothetical protein